MAIKKTADQLATEHDFNTDLEYFEYIIESRVNGQTKQVRDLFNAMVGICQKEFFDWCNNDGSLLFGYETIEEVKNICIEELTNEE